MLNHLAHQATQFYAYHSCSECISAARSTDRSASEQGQILLPAGGQLNFVPAVNSHYQKERELEKVNAFYLQKEAEV